MLENEPEGGERTGAQPAVDASSGSTDSGGTASSGSTGGGVGSGGGAETDSGGRSPEAANASDTGGSGAAESGAAESGSGEAPVRRRTTRRRTSTTASEPAPTGVPVEAPVSARATSAEAADAEVLAPVAGDTDPAPKATRRRRKATTAEKKPGAGEQDGTGLPAGVAPPLGDSGVPVGDPGTSADDSGASPRTSGPAISGTAAVGPSASGTEAAGAVTEPVPPVKVTRTRRRKAAAPPAEPTGAAATGVTPAESDLPATDAGSAGRPADEGTPSTPTSTPAGAGDAPATGSEVGAPAVPESTAGAPALGDEAGTEVAEETRRGRRRRAALSAPTVLFMAPEEESPASRGTATGTGESAPVSRSAEVEEEPAEPAETGRRRRRGRRGGESVTPEAEVEVEVEVATVAEQEPFDDTEPGVDEAEDEESASARRRRRRGRRGRGRGKGTADEIEDDEENEEPAAQVDTGEDEDDETEPEAGDGDGDGVTRRRRRRRRKGAGDSDSAAEDGVHTVVKIREPRKSVDEVQGVSGSTRLEAKRQRRRDGREQRRTRPPILSESEFLARREAVDRVMAVRQRGDRTQIAVLEDGVLVEHYVTRASAGTMAGNVYLGKVQNVLPSMEAAFVDVGRGRNAVLYAGEVNWDTTGLEGRARSIEQALRSGDSVLVQVTKDPIGHKGARLTSHVALSGRHLVYVPHGNASGISRKLPDTERKRLRDILKKLVPDGAGVIVRTAAEGASEDELARDVKRLQAQWEDIQAKAAEGGAPVLLYEEPDLVIRVVRDLFNEDFRELVVQGDEAYDMVESYLSHVSPDLVPRLRRQTGTADVFVERRIDEQILKGLDRKVFLPSGGHLVIDRTEAMTVIDVNTGKYTGAGGNLEETVTRNNLEAAEEIVRQLRLRDLGGIVVIDFIDMVLESNRELVLRRLTECLGRDRTKHQVTEITSLGLVQMTRKRIGAGLLEAFSETCDCCKGRGVIIHTEPVPEKSRPGAGERVKAVASAAPSAPTSESSTTGGRRRGRKSASPERVVVEVSDYEDTMGYDLSRYEVETPEAGEAAESAPVESAPVESTSAEPMRLAGAGDPDGIDETGDPDGEADGAEAGGGRRRARRGGTRRRTRP
ncbi:Rne/Rng family ribonuclease [Plantactinospora sp. WMMB334]|uniref:Rne/Rng family ribonuclease n=1 Tax=Plantactinospora sp. WMMB334 TaxID=3404119 RepID=UPI003B94AA02